VVVDTCLSYSVDEGKPSVPGGCSNEHCYTGCCVAPVSEKPDSRAPVGRALAPVGRA